MMSVILAILPVALQIIGFFIQKSQASAETKKQFFEWIKKAGEDYSSTRLLEYGDAQLKWLKETPWEETK